MKQGKRFGLSAEQKSDVWRRWKSGQTLHEIGRAFGKEHSSIRCLVSRHGGIAPAVRRRALLALTLREREEISRGVVSGSSIRAIAKGLYRTVSTVSREVARHGGLSVYRANQADCEAWESALRPKRCLLSVHVLEMAKHKTFTVATVCESLFLRPAKPLAARLQRKHQWAITAILPEENRPVRVYPVGCGQNSAAPKSTPEKNLRLPDSCE